MSGRARNVTGFAAILALALVVASPGRGLTDTPPVGPLPLLGPADSAMTLMGAAPGGEAGEAWGYRQLPLAVGGVRVGARALEFGSTSGPAPDPQLVFLRHTDANGWQVFDTPVDEEGQPYRGPAIVNRRSVRITHGGGGVLVGRDLRRPVGEQVVVIHRDPEAHWRMLESPPPEVLMPAEEGRPAESLAADNGSGAIAVAAFDESGGTGLLFGPQVRSLVDGIVHFAGHDWSREPICLGASPSPCTAPTGSFAVLAIDATGPGNTWAIAKTDEPGRSVVLLERTFQPGGPVWVERSLGSTPFAEEEAPGEGIAGVEPLGGAAQPMTVTSDGVWIDLTANLEGIDQDVTLFYDIGDGAVTHSWCDALACDDPLGVKLSRQLGYRSFAWPGVDFGTRVVTNPLDPGGSEETNRGTYLRFDGGQFVRMPAASGNFRPSGAFTSADNGWLEGPVEISPKTAPARLRPWPVAARAPLADVTGGPGAAPGALGSGALAVGVNGTVLRYEPGRGWQREFLLSSSGSVNRATLRGVAWPEQSRAHAVGDLGSMWMWNASDDIWVQDPGVPIAFEGNLMDVAFDPGDPSRGYAVGKGGVLLRYGKSWDQEALPPGYEGADLTSIAFAGSQAIVAAGGDLLVNDGGAWRVDSSAKALLDGVRAGSPRLFSLAGLPDGGAVAAGRDIVIERDGPGAPWRFSAQPLPGSTAIAAAAVRAGGTVRAIVSVVPQITYPLADDLPDPDPTVPPPIPPPFGLPGDGYLLRETASGWEDEQRTSFAAAGDDRPLKTDPVLSLLLDSSGNGWAVGGWSGDADAAGRGSSARNGGGRAIRERVRTAAVFRYGAGAALPPAAGRQPVPMPGGPARFAVAGHAQCEDPCADLRPLSIGPDRTLAAALQTVASTRGGSGPRALLYTGNRVKTGLDTADAARYAELLRSAPDLPVFPALGSNDAANGIGAGEFQAAFAGFPAPFGAAPAPAGISTAGIPGAAPIPGRARTHYAFDSEGPGGTVRVVVIDNSLGSLAASDPHQNPPEAQLPWLEAVLSDARSKGMPVVVMGNRSLNTSFTPKLNVAGDGTEIAQTLVNGGASVYLFDRPEENRPMRIPAGGAVTLPSFGVGTLGYRSEISGGVGLESPDSLFGDSGVLILEIGAPAAGTNVAPVGVRLIPVIEDLSLEATDGTLLRRSRPALFRGLGRRPRAGDRWGRIAAGSGSPNPSGGDPYTLFPPDQCLVAGCAARLKPRVQLRLLGPRHRRLRPPGPRLDQPPQALPRRQRQGGHRQLLRPALHIQRRRRRRSRSAPAASPTRTR